MVLSRSECLQYDFRSIYAVVRCYNNSRVLPAKFLSEEEFMRRKNRTVTWRHAVRMAINPLIVILGSEALPSIIAGNALVAIVLNLPTLGPLYIGALLTQDMFLAGTILVFLVLMLLVGNLLADIMLASVDPRIRLE